MPSKTSCFVAYASSPPARAEAVERAIESIQAGAVVDIVSWKSVSVGGRVIVSAICDEIRRRELFIAEVTGLNPNVLFELGFAISHRKRVWIIMDPNIERAKIDFDRFQLLTTIGYKPYSNSHEIISGFYEEQPYNTLTHIVYEELLQTTNPAPSKPALLYLKSDIDTEASIRIARRVAAGPLLSVIDDPKEVRVQPFSWYVQQVSSALAVVCHLLSTDYRGWELHNAKHALIAGLAHGLGKPLLMLAHEPYVSPIDYRDLLRTHRTAAMAEAILGDWLLARIRAYEQRLAAQEHYQEEARAQGELRNIAMGDPVAEFESDRVADYFVPTAAYNEARVSRHSIFVGRKGTGKTATLYKLAEELRADPRNYVCVVKPVDYELEALVAMLRLELTRSEKGYLVESFWKFLLYTELTRGLYEQTVGKPAYYDKTSAELDLCRFVEAHRSIVTPEFSVRLESAVRQLQTLPVEGTAESQRQKISERLHSTLLPEMRAILGKALRDKARVAILVDNLDKAWNPQADLRLLSELLFGLLAVSLRVAQDFADDSHSRDAVSLSLTLFLRSDILSALIGYARERDKLPIRRITWDDPESLRRVVEERFVSSGADVARPDGIWDRYFTPAVRGVPTRDYLAGSVLPRPRDLIYLVKTALQFAINRGHGRIEEKDLISAEQQYSRFALDSLLVENGTRVPRLEELIFEFVGAPEIIGDEDIKRAMSAAGLSESELQRVVDALSEFTFLGPEVGPNRFMFMYDEDNATKIQVMARKTAAEQAGGARRYQINRPFHAYLDIKPHPAVSLGQLPMNLQAGAPDMSGR